MGNAVAAEVEKPGSFSPTLDPKKELKLTIPPLVTNKKIEDKENSTYRGKNIVSVAALTVGIGLGAVLARRHS